MRFDYFEACPRRLLAALILVAESKCIRMTLNKRSLLRLAILSLFMAQFGLSFGQDAPAKDPDVIASGHLQAAPLGKVVLSECHDPWDIMLKTTRKQPPVPGTNLDWEEKQRWKAEANAERDRARELNAGMPSGKTMAGPPPTQGANFIGNQRNGQDPADNDLAVGRDGTVISTINTRIDVYDSTGQNLFSTSLNAFDSQFNDHSSFVFDPRVSYDPDEDRWVLAYLVGLHVDSTRLIIGFSQTSDPLQGWNVYALNGNPFNDGTFTDFPTIALSSEELFVTGNSFSGPASFEHGIMWQIDKFDGYNGTALDFQAYDVPYGSLHPVEGGSSLFGPRFFFIRVSSTQPVGNSITLHEMTNTLANSGVLNSPITLSLPISYSFPSNAGQPNTNIDLLVNDFRMQSSYQENDQIHFAFNSNIAGVPSIYYGVITLNLALITFSGIDGFGITYPTYDIGYPAVAYAGEVDGNGRNKSYITFLYAGETHFPGHAAAYIDASGASDMLVLKTSSTFMNPGQQRWGDYSDVSERPGKPGEVWTAGTYANLFQQQQTYISQINPPVASSLNDEKDLSTQLEVFPNPSVDRVTFRFPVETEGNYRVVIRDLTGATVKSFHGMGLWLGEATLQFNTTELAVGVYTVTVENDQRTLFSEKLSVSR